MATRMIDRNGHRWGAGISAVALIVSYIAGWDATIPALAAVMGIGVAFGLRYSPLGATYRLAKRVLSLEIPVIPEEEAPPRFAQLMGLVFLGLGTLGLYAFDSVALGWTFGLIVAVLQTLLAVSGICVGCEVYLLGKRLTARTAA